MLHQRQTQTYITIHFMPPFMCIARKWKDEVLIFPLFSLYWKAKWWEEGSESRFLSPGLLLKCPRPGLCQTEARSLGTPWSPTWIAWIQVLEPSPNAFQIAH